MQLTRTIDDVQEFSDKTYQLEFHFANGDWEAISCADEEEADELMDDFQAFAETRS